MSAPLSSYSSPAIPDRNSWSIEAPKLDHYELLRDWVENKLKSWHRLRQSQFSPNHNNRPNGTNGYFNEPNSAQIAADIEKYKEHLANSYDLWKSISDKKKQDIWLDECAKAFIREQEKHNETKRKLDLAEQKIQLLRAQLFQKSQSPDSQMYPPSMLPITREMTDQLPNSDSFNYESLLSKWKTRIQSTRSIQQPLPPLSPWATATPTNLNSNHTNGNSYAAQRQQSGPDRHPNYGNDAENPSDEDEDLADAPGDEDDLAQPNAMEKGMLDPSLESAHLDGEGQAGGRMLMGLREYTGSSSGNGRMDIGRG